MDDLEALVPPDEHGYTYIKEMTTVPLDT